jgi:hypothetical protein
LTGEMHAGRGLTRGRRLPNSKDRLKPGWPGRAWIPSCNTAGCPAEQSQGGLRRQTVHLVAENLRRAHYGLEGRTAASRRAEAAGARRSLGAGHMTGSSRRGGCVQVGQCTGGCVRPYSVLTSLQQGHRVLRAQVQAAFMCCAQKRLNCDVHTQ